MIWRHYLLLLWIYYVGLLINDVVLFWLYQEILKEHMYNSSLVSKFILRKVGGKLFSMRSPNLWYPWQQSTGQNSSTQNTTLLALAELGWERSHWQPAQQGEGPPYLESSSTSLIHPANVHIWKHVGPGVESWWRQSLPMTQRSEGRRVFWYVKIKRKEVLPETERIKIRKKCILITTEKWERHCLENQQQGSGCGNYKVSREELWKRARTRAASLYYYPRFSKQLSGSALLSILVIFIVSLSLEANWVINYTIKTSRAQYISNLTLATSKTFALNMRLCSIIYSAA